MAKSRTRTESASMEDAPMPPVSGDETVAGHGDSRDRRDRIAMRAYELYLERGGADGGDFDDWLAAERELSSSHQRSEPKA